MIFQAGLNSTLQKFFVFFFKLENKIKQYFGTKYFKVIFKEKEYIISNNF